MDPNLYWHLLAPRYTPSPSPLLGGNTYNNGGHGNSAVRRYIDTVTGQEVAVKLILPIHNFEHLKRVYREIALLTLLAPSGCVVALRNVICSEARATAGSAFLLVFQSLAYDLQTLYFSAGSAVPAAHTKALAFDMLARLATLHRAGVTHRDMKLTNIASDGQSAVLLDLGLARTDPAAAAAAAAGPVPAPYQLTGVVQTPGYRAPEVPLTDGLGSYTPAIDMWGAGCILLEQLRCLHPDGPTPTLFRAWGCRLRTQPSNAREHRPLTPPFPLTPLFTRAAVRSDPPPLAVLLQPDAGQEAILQAHPGCAQSMAALGAGLACFQATLPAGDPLRALALEPSTGLLRIPGPRRAAAQSGVWEAFQKLRAQAQLTDRAEQVRDICRTVGLPADAAAAGLPPADTQAGLHAHQIFASLAASRASLPPPWTPATALAASLPHLRFLFEASELAALHDLLGGLLAFNPAQRLTAEQALAHPFWRLGCAVHDAAKVARAAAAAPVAFEEAQPSTVLRLLDEYVAAYRGLQAQQAAGAGAGRGAAQGR